MLWSTTTKTKSVGMKKRANNQRWQPSLECNQTRVRARASMNVIMCELSLLMPYRPQMHGNKVTFVHRTAVARAHAMTRFSNLIELRNFRGNWMDNMELKEWNFENDQGVQKPGSVLTNNCSKLGLCKWNEVRILSRTLESNCGMLLWIEIGRFQVVGRFREATRFWLLWTILS